MPAAPLFTPLQVTLATAFGGPAAGAILLARNEVARPTGLGPGQTVTLGIGMTLVSLLLVAFLPVQGMAPGVAVGALMGVRVWARSIEAKEAARGAPAGGGPVTGVLGAIAIGLVFLVSFTFPLVAFAPQ